MRSRLDRALSKRGVASRAEAQRLIRAGHVTVSGAVVTDPARMWLRVPTRPRRRDGRIDRRRRAGSDSVS
jgi:16S rRNA U516 pseudouridylate synthase RsuA-like enzyme